MAVGRAVPPSIPPEPGPNTPPAGASHRPFASCLKGVIFGCDGQQGRTDGLIGLLETVIPQRSVLDRYEQEREVARKGVERERKRHRAARPEEWPEEWLATLGEAELRALLTRVPHAVLRKLKP